MDILNLGLVNWHMEYMGDMILFDDNNIYHNIFVLCYFISFLSLKIKKKKQIAHNMANTI